MYCWLLDINFMLSLVGQHVKTKHEVNMGFLFYNNVLLFEIIIKKWTKLSSIYVMTLKVD